MLRHLATRISSALSADGSDTRQAEKREHAIRLATAVLMIDVARSDSDFSEAEFDLLLDLIRSHFRLDAEDASNLANTAHAEAEELVEISRFTQLLHDNLSEEEKLHVVALLWKIAFADGRLSRHEDALVLKISDLLYVNRARVMRLKDDARKASA